MNSRSRTCCTRLPNRRYVDRHLAQELERAQRGGTRVSVLLLDMDRFKCINDEFGHEAGTGRLSMWRTPCAQACAAMTSARGWPAMSSSSCYPTATGNSRSARAARCSRPLRGGFLRGAGRARRPRHQRRGRDLPEDGQSPDELLAAADRRMHGNKSSRKEALANLGEFSRT